MTVPEWKAYGPVRRNVLASSKSALYANAQCMHGHSCVIKQMTYLHMRVLADCMRCITADMFDLVLYAACHSMPLN